MVGKLNEDVVVKTSASRSHLGWNWIVVSFGLELDCCLIGWDWIVVSLWLELDCCLIGRDALKR